MDVNGVVKYSFSYDEFGNTTATNRTIGGDPTYLPTLCQLLTYVGAYGVRNETGSTGMFLMGQRWYDSTVGRFISQDPIGFNGGPNLFGYPLNPIQRIDPSGLQPSVSLNGIGLGPKHPASLSSWLDPADWNDPLAYVNANGNPVEKTIYYGSLGSMAVAGIGLTITQPQISLSAIRATAAANGIDCAGATFAYSWRTAASGMIFRGSNVIYFGRYGLLSGSLAMRTLAHELFHLEEAAQGLPVNEAAAIAAESTVAGITINPTLLQRVSTMLWGPK